MFEIVFNALKFGIVLCFLVGPVFFAIIQTSVERGFKNGLLVAIGVSLSDIAYVVIGYVGLIRYFNETEFRLYLAYTGGVILILFGMYYLFFRSKRKYSAPLDIAKERGLLRYLIKGFVINGFNPAVFIFWLGAISFASLDFGYNQGFEFYTFFGTVLAFVLCTDILKAFLADKLRNLLTLRAMKILNVMVGVCLLFFGARLLFVASDFSL
jgi:threonine/homoserine/homoserine lactone efflux protein